VPTATKGSKPILAAALLACLALLLVASPTAARGIARLSAATPAKGGPATAGKRSKKHRRPRVSGHQRRVVNPRPRPPVVKSPALLEAGFEENLLNWNTAGVGEVIPAVTASIAREGSKSCEFVLTGNQNRSELILGGNGGGSTAGQIEFHEGDEYWYGFSFYIQQMVYGAPGAHNLIMQFKSDGTGSPEFGLQLWDVHGEKGLWTGGPSQEVDGSGERFLAPLTEQAWHDVQIHFRASSVGAGFYEVFLDGNLVDAQTGVSMIVPGHQSAYIKDGLYRNGATAPGTSEIFLDAAKLGQTQASVLPD
jgi:Polysaccharide lyase